MNGLLTNRKPMFELTLRKWRYAGRGFSRSTLAGAACALILACQPKRHPSPNSASANTAVALEKASPNTEEPPLGDPGEKEQHMTSEDRLFFEVELGTNSPCECTPALPDGATQVIVIAAPTRVPFELGVATGERGKFTSIPICAAYVMNVPSPPSDEPILFHVTNRETGKQYEGPLQEVDESPEEPPPEDDPVPAETLVGVSVTGYFNHNLLDHVSLPPEQGTHEISVSWRGVRSNVAVVDLLEVNGRP